MHTLQLLKRLRRGGGVIVQDGVISGSRGRYYLTVIDGADTRSPSIYNREIYRDEVLGYLRQRIGGSARYYTDKPGEYLDKDFGYLDGAIERLQRFS